MKKTIKNIVTVVAGVLEIIEDGILEFADKVEYEIEEFLSALESVVMGIGFLVEIGCLLYIVLLLNGYL